MPPSVVSEMNPLTTSHIVLSTAEAYVSQLFIQVVIGFNTTLQGEVKDDKLLNLKVTPESRRKDVLEWK